MANQTPAVMQDRLREVLDYDPATGVFRWRMTRSNRVGGSIAGRIHKATGYRQIKIDSVYYSAHRLAWVHVYGVWPAMLDHKDGNPGNNAIANLRLATKAQNKANSKRQSNNTSGIKGISQNPNGRWRARIVVGKRHRQIGTFATAEEAAAAYEAAARECFGEFARSE